MEVGVRCTQAGAVLLLGHNGHPALKQLGAIGGIEEASGNPFGVIRRGLQTYVTALVRQHGGVEGLKEAEKLRAGAELTAYRLGYADLKSNRQRRIYRTVTWFALQAGRLQRRREGLEGANRTQTAYNLQAAVRSGDNHGSRGD